MGSSSCPKDSSLQGTKSGLSRRIMAVDVFGLTTKERRVSDRRPPEYSSDLFHCAETRHTCACVFLHGVVCCASDMKAWSMPTMTFNIQGPSILAAPRVDESQALPLRRFLGRRGRRAQDLRYSNIPRIHLLRDQYQGPEVVFRLCRVINPDVLYLI